MMESDHVLVFLRLFNTVSLEPFVTSLPTSKKSYWTLCALQSLVTSAAKNEATGREQIFQPGTQTTKKRAVD